MDKFFCESIAEYLELEKETLRVLNGSKYVREASLYTNLQSVFSQSRGRKFSNMNLYIRFNSSMFGSKHHEVSLGGQFYCGRNSLANASYSVEVIQSSDNDTACVNKVVSRLHFDYASRDQKNASQHPVFHIQMWGQLPEHLRSSGVGYQFEENRSMSCPRVPFAPLSLALFLNMMIKELGTDGLRKILKSPEWDALVKRHEQKILMPFFKRLQGCIGSGDQLCKFYYGDRK